MEAIVNEMEKIEDNLAGVAMGWQSINACNRLHWRRFCYPCYLFPILK